MSASPATPLGTPLGTLAASSLTLCGAALGHCLAEVQPVFAAVSLVSGSVLGVAGVWRLARQAFRPAPAEPNFGD
jgi:hypothetical protein